MQTWTEQSGPLPTLPGKSPGIVGYWPRTPASRPRATVQCAVCYRTLTGPLQAVVGKCNFAADADSDFGSLKYRRCWDCIEAHRHPERETMTA